MKGHVRLFAVLLAVGLMAVAAAAKDAPQPAGDVVLTVSGTIALTNGEGVFAMDEAMLRSLPMVEYFVTDPWMGESTYGGVLLSTLLEYVETENPREGQLPGNSFADLLCGEETERDSHIVVYDEYGPVRMIRNREWKYVRRFAYGPDELYNLRNDPAERHNLAGHVNHRAVEDELREHLTKWFSCYVNPEHDGANEPVTGAGQFGLCGTAEKGRQIFSSAGVESILGDTKETGQNIAKRHGKPQA